MAEADGFAKLPFHAGLQGKAQSHPPSRLMTQEAAISRQATLSSRRLPIAFSASAMVSIFVG